VKLNRTYQQLLGSDGTLRKDVRYFEVYGGRRSGKSHDVDAIVGLTATVEPGHFIVGVRKVATTLKDSIFAEFKGFFRDNEIPVQTNETDKEIRLANGSRVRCFGLDDPEKLKSLKGATIIVLEEANELTEDDFDSLDAGLSPSNYPGRIILLHNPVPKVPGLDYWYEKRFQNIPHELSKAIINEPSNALVLRTWYKDNAFCPPESIRVLENYRLTNPQKYKLWALGESVRVEGVVFNNWDIVPEVPKRILHDSMGVGLDFGFSNDPSAAVRVWIRDDEMWVKLLVYSTGLHNEMLLKALKESGVDEHESVIADSARPDIIEDLHRRGLRGVKGVSKHKGYKEDIANRAMSFKIHLIEGDTDLIREFSTYAWARDKTGKPLPKLQDGDDHGIDAMIMLLADSSKFNLPLIITEQDRASLASRWRK
jgi:phage terminase large subunit